MPPTGPGEDAGGPQGEEWDLETALEHVGVGRFQWAALAVCGLANAADAVEILGLSLVIPAAEDDLGLTAASKSALSGSIFLGMLLGGLLWGPLGDSMGRRVTLVASLAINGAFGALSAAARGVGDLVLLRVLAGVGVGGSVPVVFSFLAELLPARVRGKFMVGLAAHWMVGSIYAAGVGWAMIPSAGWRPFLAVAALPAWAAAASTLLLLPESPRHLLVHGKTAAAEQAIRRMAATNRVVLPSGMLLRGTQKAAYEPHMSHSLAAAAQGGSPPGSKRSSDGGGGSPGGAAGLQLGGGKAAAAAATAARRRVVASWLQGLRDASRATGITLRELVQPPLRSRFWPLVFAWVGLCGGWYSTVLWIPEYFKQRGAGEASLYASTFAVSAANLPGNIASVWLVDRLGRRLTACVCLAGSCLAVLGFAAAPADPVWSVAAACFFNAVSVGGWNALDLLSTEVFPTEVRSTAMGVLGAMGRLSSFSTTALAGALMGVKIWAPLVVAAGLLAGGSLATLLLPEMAMRPLEDTLEDAAANNASGGGAAPRGGSLGAGGATDAGGLAPSRRMRSRSGGSSGGGRAQGALELAAAGAAGHQAAEEGRGLLSDAARQGCDEPQQAQQLGARASHAERPRRPS